MLLSLERARKDGKIIGFTASTFDLLHPGHIAMLAEAKSMCDVLVVGLLSDPTISRPGMKNKPVQSLFERFVQIQAVSYIDYLIPFESEEDLEQMILLIMPDIRFVGEEYRDKDHTGKGIKGVEIFYNKRKHDFSSSELRKRLKDSNEPCISCGKYSKHYDASHYWSVGGYPGLRFNEANCHKSCVTCNQHLHGNIAEYTPRLIAKIGQAEFDKLQSDRHKENKLNISEVKELIETYNQKIKGLTN